MVSQKSMSLIQSTDCKKDWYDFSVIYHLLYDGKPHFLKEISEKWRKALCTLFYHFIKKKKNVLILSIILLSSTEYKVSCASSCLTDSNWNAKRHVKCNYPV